MANNNFIASEEFLSSLKKNADEAIFVFKNYFYLQELHKIKFFGIFGHEPDFTDVIIFNVNKDKIYLRDETLFILSIKKIWNELLNLQRSYLTSGSEYMEAYERNKEDIIDFIMEHGIETRLEEREYGNINAKDFSLIFNSCGSGSRKWPCRDTYKISIKKRILTFLKDEKRADSDSAYLNLNNNSISTGSKIRVFSQKDMNYILSVSSYDFERYYCPFLKSEKKEIAGQVKEDTYGKYFEIGIFRIYIPRTRGCISFYLKPENLPEKHDSLIKYCIGYNENIKEEYLQILIDNKEKIYDYIKKNMPEYMIIPSLRPREDGNGIKILEFSGIKTRQGRLFKISKFIKQNF